MAFKQGVLKELTSDTKADGYVVVKDTLLHEYPDFKKRLVGERRDDKNSILLSYEKT
ncbi:MAG: hypothetical protein AB7F59_03230 [Bdellovibrionales bacterium]